MNKIWPISKKNKKFENINQLFDSWKLVKPSSNGFKSNELGVSKEKYDSWEGERNKETSSVGFGEENDESVRDDSPEKLMASVCKSEPHGVKYSSWRGGSISSRNGSG